jgi:hypothetical protein
MDKPLSLHQIRPVLASIHRAAKILDDDQEAQSFLGRPTGRLTATQRSQLRALAWVSQALDPDATAEDRVEAKRHLRRIVQHLESKVRGEEPVARHECRMGCCDIPVDEPPMTTQHPNQEKP